MSPSDINIALGVELLIQRIYRMCINMKRLIVRNVHECIYTQRLVYISHTPNTYSKHMSKTSGTMLADWTSGTILHHVDLEVSRTTQTFVYSVII